MSTSTTGMLRFALLMLVVLPAVVHAADCVEPTLPVLSALEVADPALVTWTSDTPFSKYPPTVKLPSRKALDERIRRIEARLPGFSPNLDETGKLTALTSRLLPCRFVDRAGPTRDPWFEELAWTLELAAWDAIGHTAPPSPEDRAWTNVTLTTERKGEERVPVFVVWFSDPRPVPRAGKDLTAAALRKKVGPCRLEAVRTVCPPCRPSPGAKPSECRCSFFVRERRACGAHLVFRVEDHYLDENGVRRFLRVAIPEMDDARLPPAGEEATWNFSKQLPYLDAVTGASLMHLWDTEASPVPIP